MQLGYAVDSVAAHAPEVGHAHITLTALVDQRKARDAAVIAPETDAHRVQKPRVDLVDDLQVPGQQLREHGERPLLQCLGQERVIGVAEGAARDVPSLVPAHRLFVHQQAHQLGDGNGGMGVVELHGELLVKPLHRDLLTTHDAQHVLQRAGDEKELLLQPQLLALERLVVGIEDLGQILRDDLLVHRSVIVAVVEHRKVERFGRFGTPEPQRVRGVVVVTEDRRVVGNADDDALGDPAYAVAPVLVGPALRAAAQLDLHRPLRTRDVPGRAEAQPLVSALDLPAVDDLLLEDAKLVADAVAHRGDLQRGHGIEKAGGQPPQPAVAQPRFLLLLQQLVEVQPQLRDRLLHLAVDA